MSLHLAKLLQNDEAMLLPELFSMFQQHAVQSIDRFPNFTKNLKTSLPTIRWFLSSISNHLGNDLGITCKHKQYGTLLFKRNGDILKALSKALGKAQQSKKSETTVRSVVQSMAKSEKVDTHSDAGVIRACAALNERINSQIKELVHKYQADPLLCAEFSPDTFIQQLDPLLLQCIQILTTPQNVPFAFAFISRNAAVRVQRKHNLSQYS
jgi:hypothetical protein